MDDDDDPDVVFPRTVAADGSDDAEDATTRIIIIKTDRFDSILLLCVTHSAGRLPRVGFPTPGRWVRGLSPVVNRHQTVFLPSHHPHRAAPVPTTHTTHTTHRVGGFSYYL